MPQKEAASSMKRPKETVCKSTDVSNPFLGFYFRRCNRLRRKLEHRCFLTLQQVSQQHHLPVWKFQRIMMRVWVVLVDLPKDGRRVIDHFRLPRQTTRVRCTLPEWRRQALFPEERKLPCRYLPGAANPIVPVLK